MKKLLATLAIVCFAAAGASAQIDEDPDGIGLYFDMAGTMPCLDGSYGFSTGYIVLTNISRDGGIGGWEAHVTIETEATGHMVFWAYPPNSLNAATPPDFVVGIGGGLPWSPAIVVATMTYLQHMPGQCIRFYVGPSNTPSLPGHAIYANRLNPGDLVPLQISSGSTELPAAALNCGCGVVATETNTWGGVKALYQ